MATLVIFGGPLLRHFYITLMIGIIIGTYSSIFNATPLVIVWDNLGNKGRTPRKRSFEVKPLVEKPLVGGVEQTVETEAVSADDKSGDVPKAVRPKRKKKRF